MSTNNQYARVSSADTLPKVSRSFFALGFSLVDTWYQVRSRLQAFLEAVAVLGIDILNEASSGMVKARGFNHESHEVLPRLYWTSQCVCTLF